jgi:rRNA biogenesis protein RRP5
MEQSKTGDIDKIRSIFERVITLNLSSKKMKYFFQRYLKFEKENGTPETVDHVREAAQNYVERKTSVTL